jgi:vacuolar-type H+-ATPase subunit C/Vma6
MMLDAGERAYAFSKSCGIIGRSFVGKRIPLLANLRTLSELDRLVFPELGRELPGRELLSDLESRIEKRAVGDILAVVNIYPKPPELLIRQLRAYEYSNLKTCLNHIIGGIKTIPPLCDIGRFRTVRFEAFPDLAAMLTGTEFEFILSKNITAGSDNFEAVQTELDNQYYSRLIESMRRLSNDDRAFAQQILEAEISLRNCIWALRLRTYFGKEPVETGEYLMDIKMHWGPDEIPGDLHHPSKSSPHRKRNSLAAAAFESLNFPLDSRAAWHGWRWEKLLNPEDDAAPGWTADPRYFQNAASKYLYRLALRYFHMNPMAVSTVFCFIKIKQFEEDLLTSIAEGLGLSMDSIEIFKMLGDPA